MGKSGPIKAMIIWVTACLVGGVFTLGSWSVAGTAQAVVVDGVDWGDIDPGGERLGNAPIDFGLTVYFGYNTPLLEPAARSVSDPNSVRYGKYSSITDAAVTYGATTGQEQALNDALAGVGITPDMSPARTNSRAAMTVAQAQVFFGVPFGLYLDDDQDQVIAPDSQPTLPGNLNSAVNAVYGIAVAYQTDPPTDSPAGSSGGAPTPPTLASPVRSGVPAGCPEGVAVGAMTPNQLATAYGYEQLHDRGIQGQGQRLAILQLDANVSESDMATFAECFGFDTPTQLRQVNVGGDPSPDSENVSEATLDAQVVLQVAPQLEVFDLYSYNATEEDALAQFLELLTMPLDPTVYGATPVDVVSFSYGVCELVAADSTPMVSMWESVVTVAAVAGITYVGPSGDDGSSDCRANVADLNTPSVDLPSALPWITSVGGTGVTLTGPPLFPDLPPNTIPEQIATDERFESVWNDTLFPSGWFAQQGAGGGASTLLDRPYWQVGPGVPAGSTRLTPDVAMFADSRPGWTLYCTAGDCGDNPGWTALGGTSAATPQVAGLIALMNQAVDRNAANHPRPKLGFVNPYLYDIANRQRLPDNPMAEALRDVTTGNNDIAGVGCCDATTGYDIASGWGSLYADSLNEAIFATPSAPGVTSVDAGFRDAKVQVNAPVSPGGWPITGYQFTVDGGQTWTDAQVQGDPTAGTVSMVVGGLPGAANLPLAVRAVNAAGPGLASDEVPLTTLGARFEALVESIRVLDTRENGGPVVPGTPVVIDVSPPVGIDPDAVVAVAYNLTVTGTQGSGYAVAYPSLDAAPDSSTINWTGANQTVANSFVVGADGLNVSVAVVGSAAQVVFDVMGYYVLDDAQALFVPLEPERAYDSRTDGSTLAGGSSVSVPLTGLVPEGATAVAYTLTETGTVGSGFLTVGVPGEPRPQTSVLNWTRPAMTVANSATAALPTTGPPAIEVFAGGRGSTEFVVDVIGYFAPIDVAPEGLQFAPIDPARSYDSRLDGGPLSGGQSRITTIDVPALPGASTDVGAAAVNLTVTGTVASGYLTLAPGNTTSPPASSTINWMTTNATLANGTVVGVADSNLATFAGGDGSAQYLTDIAGYYTPVSVG